MTLCQYQAQHRYACIQEGSIKYSFHLNLSPHGYTGLSQIQFALKKVSASLFIDCSARKIIKFIINGKLVQKPRQQGSHLYLDGDKIVTGVNTLMVLYENTYDTDERGLMSFVDVDGKQYLYTTFQPYFAHRVFGLFDQPDLRACMNLSVACPMAWTEVLSNQFAAFNVNFNEQKYLSTAPTWHKEQMALFLKDNNNLRMVVFPKTKPMPTYLYCVMAGPFQKIQLKERYNNIPMSLYCSTFFYPQIQRMAPYLFEATVECMRFFEKFFGVPYPFCKYDQIFVHEMESCAMENIGMVTFHDAYIYGDEQTQEKTFDLAQTMAHELAHHWFGNLVAIKWWNDLWLKQSFAQFTGYYVFQAIQKDLKVVQFQSSMSQALVKKSDDGYIDDMSVNTHPIRATVQSTSVCEAIFDGITYIKGASTLKQLVYIMGAQNFSAALKDYFTKFAFKNTTISDFISCVEPHFNNEYDLTIEQWRKYWLEQASFNVLQPLWWKGNLKEEGQNQKILTIIQRPYDQKYPTLRPHKIKIALFKQDCTYDVIEVFLPAKPRVDIPLDPQLAQNYKAVLLNFQDLTYAKVKFDKQSKEFFSKNLLKINDLLTRTYIWRNFYDMVADAVIPSTEYIDLFVSHIAKQTSDTIVERNYQFVIKAVELYTPEEYQNELFTKLFNFTLATLEKTIAQKKNRLIILRQNLCRLANTQLAISTLYKWYQGKYSSLNNHGPTIANRWQIVGKIFSLDIPNDQKRKILDKQLTLDRSSTANLEKMKCLAMICSDDQFEEHYKTLLDHRSSMTVNTKKYLIEGLITGHNQKRLLNYEKRFLKDLQSNLKTLSPAHVNYFIDGILPAIKIQSLITGLKEITIQDKSIYQIKHKISGLIDTLERRLKCHAVFRDSLWKI